MVGQHPLRDKIISSICEMDIRMLHVLLPDYGIYENTYKEVWLGKLESFFKTCKSRGDSSIDLLNGPGHINPKRLDEQRTWCFKSDATGFGFCISFIMDGQQITGFEEVNTLDYEDLENQTNQVILHQAFKVYDDEKIGFISSVEFKKMKKQVGAFLAEFHNPRNRFVGLPWIKKKLKKYNHLFFDLLEDEVDFEYKSDMLKIYHDLYVLKVLFSRQKTVQGLFNRYKDKFSNNSPKKKIAAVKWLLLNEKKISNYLIPHYELTLTDGKINYVFQIDDETHSLRIYLPKMKMIIEDCIKFQHDVSFLYSYFITKFLDEQQDISDEMIYGHIYLYFEDRMDVMIEEYEDWAKQITPEDGWGRKVCR